MKESRVLVIITGGTFTMVQSEFGYVAASGLASRLRENVTLHDKKYAEQHPLESDDWCVTPLTAFKKHIRYKIMEFENLIDSSNISI